MVAHSHHLGNNGLAGPLHTKDLSELLQVVGCGLTDGEDSVSKPPHAQRAELLVKEFDSKLARQQRDVLDYGETHAPLLVLSKLDNRRQERL